MKNDDYTSIGVNFGDLNIEFIRFNVRFGIRNSNFNGFSVVAFTVQDSIDKIKSVLVKKRLNNSILRVWSFIK